MKRLAILALVLFTAIGASVSFAQEAQETPDPLFVQLNYITVKPGMMTAFMAAMADHKEWHASTGDTHYYGVSQVISGPRTGQILIATNTLTAEQLDEYMVFGEQDMGDAMARGMFSYIEGVETIVISPVQNLGNPPPAGANMPMIHVYQLDVDFASTQAFTEALNTMDETQKELGVGQDSYNAWVIPITGTSVRQRWFVQWTDGWAGGPEGNPEDQAKMVEAMGGQDAYQEFMDGMMGTINDITVATYVNLPELSFQPEGQ